MTITIPSNLAARLEQESARLNTTLEERLAEILGRNLAPEKNFEREYIQSGLEKIKILLKSIPCINHVTTSSIGEPFWWLKFSIDIDSRIGWTVVQEFGHILNYLSVNDKLPTIFYPVSPPPYMNGGPRDFLSWVIEPVIPFVDTNYIFDFLIGRLPKEYEKEESWLLDE